ncbi:hypothetical protein L3Q82_020018 [Scortum barcoo]|uniref:Uncharacterized protein n=1 Tax=Scortum barcoo TaxID=214431 RepID=A0ACB8VG23_9TELE|nr:hypothetical protein L3Q82_020018 [Scortum barcoo]
MLTQQLNTPDPPKLPSVSVSPSAEIVEGSSVTLTCSSDANPAANYTWYKENGNITSLSKEPQLVFSSIQSSDSGEYYCTAENELGPRMSEYISINVKYHPKLPSVSVSPSAEIVEGSSVTLTCSSDANPAANYTWYKENGNVTSPSKEPQLVFRSIQSSDSGEYYCTAENELGTRTSGNISINVKYPPKLPSVSVSPSAEIVEGSSVTLTCSSDANPAANYTWYKENEDSPKASGQIFTITDFTAEHSGNYYCEAQNRIGCRNSKLHVIVLPGTFNGTPIAVVLTVVLAVILISVFILIRKKRGEKRDDRNQCQQPEQDDLHYASVEFSNIKPAQRHRHKQEDEENVEYATVKVKSGSTAARKKHGEKRDYRNQGQQPEQDDLHYASIEFSNNKPAQRRRHKQEDEENVEYAAVKVKSGRTAVRNQESAREDLAAVYSTVNKPW